MESFEAIHEIKYLGFRRVMASVIGLGRADNNVDDIRETTAASAAFFHCVIDLCRHDKLPTVLIEKAVDDVFNLFLGDEVAAANEHGYIRGTVSELKMT